MTNSDLSLHLYCLLKKMGVDHVVYCAGARSAPAVVALEKHDFKTYSFFEERSAGFFALGLARANQKPVAVLTTSGTAVAELLPVCIEAYYQGIPLILVTADRPKSYRNTGSPQTIEQVGIFSVYVEDVWDIDMQNQQWNFSWSGQKPVQINVCFDEPLIDRATITEAEVANKIDLKLNNTRFVEKKLLISTENIKQPLVILGQIQKNQKEQITKTLLKLKAPIYAESICGLRSNEELSNILVYPSDYMMEQMLLNQEVDSIVRIGGVPTARIWRDLEKKYSHIPVLSFTETNFSGLSRFSSVFKLSDLPLLEQLEAFPEEIMAQIKTKDCHLQNVKQELLNQFPNSEPALCKALAELIGESPIYLGNSLPIRHWDQFILATSEEIYANRGANGIDGQISTYLGWSEGFGNSFCLVGDLTALYDLVSLGLVDHSSKQRRCVCVLNNFGGQIFSRVFNNKRFINEHNIEFSNWAKMWGWSYLKISSPEQLERIHVLENMQNNTIIEIQPDEKQTELFWSKWDEVCRLV